LDQIASDA
jgi:hypothetical protein